MTDINKEVLLAGLGKVGFLMRFKGQTRARFAKKMAEVLVEAGMETNAEEILNAIRDEFLPQELYQEQAKEEYIKKNGKIPLEWSKESLDEILGRNKSTK